MSSKRKRQRSSEASLVGSEAKVNLGCVVEREKDGEYITVEWTDKNGERVVGVYKFLVWKAAPPGVLAEIRRIIGRAPGTSRIGRRRKAQNRK
jgi:hypothetical protein